MRGGRGGNNYEGGHHTSGREGGIGLHSRIKGKRQQLVTEVKKGGKKGNSGEG